MLLKQMELYGHGGQGGNGQLGIGNLTSRSSPVQVGALTSWYKISGGNESGTFATKTDGTLWVWGFNGQYQLGTGTTTNYSSPKQLGALTTWSKITGGWLQTIAIKTDGTLWSWGRSNYGQLGLGNTTAYSSPKQVGSSAGWLNVAAGSYFTLAIAS